MFCAKCGNHSDTGERFCRKCGTDLENALLDPRKQSLLNRRSAAEELDKMGSKDPDQLTGDGIGSVIVGDGFFMVAVLLSATNASISSALWLLLLIPAFFFFGKGFADLFQARQIRRRIKQNELADAPATGVLTPARSSLIDVFEPYTSDRLTTPPSVTERTTRQL